MPAEAAVASGSLGTPVREETEMCCCKIERKCKLVLVQNISDEIPASRHLGLRGKGLGVIFAFEFQFW